MTKVLVVEDEPTARYSMARVLTQAGLEVQAASDSAGAMRVLEHGRMDIIVSDIRLPNGLDGFALVNLARKQQPDLKVLYVTALDVTDGAVQDKVLRKPFSDRILLDEIAAAVER